MAEPTPYQKLAANLAYLRKRGASPERQKQEIEKFKLSQDAKTKAERALSGWEKVGATASKGLSGLTFGTFDELAATVDGKEEQRILQNQLEEDNPALAFTAELAGSMAVPGSFLRAPAKIAQTATRMERARRAAKAAGVVVGEGMAQGGAAAFGNAEGNVGERLDELGEGAAWGGGVAAGLGAGGRTVRVVRKTSAKARGADVPNVDEMATRMTDQDLADARQSLFTKQQRGLADETMVADVLPQGEGALRAARTNNRATASKIDTELRSRSTRLANVADDRLSQHTGTRRQSGDKTVSGIVDEARVKSKPFYEAADVEAMGPAVPEAQARIDDALMRPKVQEYVNRVQQDAPYGGKPMDSHDVLTQAYQEMGEDIRLLRDKRAARTITVSEKRELNALVKEQQRLRAAVGTRSPSWLKGNEEFAGEMALKDAYELGSKNTPADMVADDIAGLSQSEAKLYREGATQNRLRGNVPNPDLGEFARFADVMQPVASREKADLFKALHGEAAYREYMNDLQQMAKMQRMRAGGGESTTVDKWIEQMQASDNPDLGQIALQFASGNLAGAGRSVVSKALDWAPLDRLMQSKRGADKSADFLMQRGNDKVQEALDLIERLRAEGKLPRPRNFRRPNPAYAPSRMAGSLSSG